MLDIPSIPTSSSWLPPTLLPPPPSPRMRTPVDNIEDAKEAQRMRKNHLSSMSYARKKAQREKVCRFSSSNIRLGEPRTSQEVADLAKAVTDLTVNIDLEEDAKEAQRLRKNHLSSMAYARKKAQRAKVCRFSSSNIRLGEPRTSQEVADLAKAVTDLTVNIDLEEDAKEAQRLRKNHLSSMAYARKKAQRAKEAADLAKAVTDLTVIPLYHYRI
ncbi:hypothetical protein FN846DRAFT_635636 [Sphaerosporella brunnea]|uniref:Uncharacterized protein n=1 Tax=Sphaerosporella brunnea TaxID=1250544 RepID=A0A5J5EB58_9PEZI|nr:hypothetical protein FN846DRAFT_635636 [Sphaerosporella brunnea]